MERAWLHALHGPDCEAYPAVIGDSIHYNCTTTTATTDHLPTDSTHTNYSGCLKLRLAQYN